MTLPQMGSRFRQSRTDLVQAEAEAETEYHKSSPRLKSRRDAKLSRWNRRDLSSDEPSVSLPSLDDPTSWVRKRVISSPIDFWAVASSTVPITAQGFSEPSPVVMLACGTRYQPERRRTQSESRFAGRLPPINAQDLRDVRTQTNSSTVEQAAKFFGNGRLPLGSPGASDTPDSVPSPQPDRSTWANRSGQQIRSAVSAALQFRLQDRLFGPIIDMDDPVAVKSTKKPAPLSGLGVGVGLGLVYPSVS